MEQVGEQKQEEPADDAQQLQQRHVASSENALNDDEDLDNSPTNHTQDAFEPNAADEVGDAIGNEEGKTVETRKVERDVENRDETDDIQAHTQGESHNTHTKQSQLDENYGLQPGRHDLGSWWNVNGDDDEFLTALWQDDNSMDATEDKYGASNESKGSHPSRTAPNSTRNSHAGIEEGSKHDQSQSNGAGKDNHQIKQSHGDAHKRKAHDISRGTDNLEGDHTGDEEDLTQKLRQQVEQDDVPEYEREFSGAAAAEEILVGMVDENEVKEREKAIEHERIEYEAAEAELYVQRERRLAKAEKQARSHVHKEKQNMRKRLKEKEKARAAEMAARESVIHREWNKAERALRQRLHQEKATVRSKYGQLEPGRAGVRKLSVNWNDLPQPMDIRIHQLRATKNKLPKGNYAILVTLFDKLGGSPLRWSQLTPGTGLPSNTVKGVNLFSGESREYEVGKSASTRPFAHRGRFYDIDTEVGQSVGIAVPPPSSLKPSHCLIFEVFILGTTRYPVDRVVAWGALPAVDAEFRPNRGKFKVPLIRNEIDYGVDQYIGIEKTISADLDNWLANMYVEIVLLPREVELSEVNRNNQNTDNSTTPGNTHKIREYDVEVAYTRELLQLSKTADYSGFNKVKRRLSNEHNEKLQNGNDETTPANEPEGADTAQGNDHKLGPSSSFHVNVHSEHENETGFTSGEDSPSKLFEEVEQEDDEDMEWDVYEDVKIADPFLDRRKITAHHKSSLNDKEENNGGSEDDYSMEERENGSDMDSEHIPDEAKAFLGEHSNAPVHKLDIRKQPQRRQNGARGSEDHSLVGYYYAVTRQQGKHLWGRKMPESLRKLKYIKMELAADMAERNWKTVAFWIQLFMLLLALYLRIYIHYLSQWLVLRAMRIPIFTFEPTPIEVRTKYMAQVLPFEYELASVAAGPLGVNVLTGIFIVIAWASLSLFGHVPETYSRFVAFFGIGAVLNPILILVVDSALRNFDCKSKEQCAEDFGDADCACHEGDAFKLANRFEADEGSAVAGIVLTVFVYSVLMLLAGFLLYVFLLYIHIDGRMLDLYRRLNAPDTIFLVPDDLEISADELNWICAKSSKWRGPDGTRRKIAVCEYVVTDPLDENIKETTSHLIIYHVTLNGQRELHRHFLRLEDGTIVELFGSLSDKMGVGSGALEQVLLDNKEKEFPHANIWEN